MHLDVLGGQVSKLYNDPLLRTSISLVASSGEGGSDEERQLALSRSISTALLLAVAVGLTQVILWVPIGNLQKG